MSSQPIKLMVVDDNDFIAESLRRRLASDPTFEWCGWLDTAAALPAAAAERRPHIVLLDIDIPGDDSFDALRRVAESLPDTRIVMFSGHVRKALIDRAITDGAWGYLSKNEPVPTILDIVRQVAAGEFTLSPEAQTEHQRR